MSRVLRHGDSMFAITLHQPYASLIMEGWKPYETRGWETHYRGPLAIHAGGRQPDAATLRRLQDTLAACWRYPKHDTQRIFGHALNLPTSAILGIVSLTDIFAAGVVAPKLPPIELALGDFSPGRFAWRLQDITPAKAPLPIGGRQRLWTWAPSCGIHTDAEYDQAMDLIELHDENESRRLHALSQNDPRIKDGRIHAPSDAPLQR